MRATWHVERHRTAHIGWLRAAVLGANDGLISTASLVVGYGHEDATQEQFGSYEVTASEGAAAARTAAR